MDLVSVIVPVYNVKEYLRKCVESIISQSYLALEIILVDDGSQDGSSFLCDQLAMQDDRIKVVHQTNQGLGYARNAGLKHVTGKFVTFIDSDDYIGKRHIEDLLSAMSENNVDVALGFYSSVNQEGVVIPRKSKLTAGVYDKERIHNELLLPLIGTDENCRYDTVVESSCCMNMYRVSIINNHDLHFTSEREAVAEDQFFNIDYFVYANRVAVTEVNDYFYYENPQSISRKYDKLRFDRTVNYYLLLHHRVLEHNLSKFVGKRIERSFLMKIRVAIRHIVLSDMSFTSKKLEIKRILNHELIQKVIEEFPFEVYPIQIKILMVLMREKRICGIYLLIVIREYMRKIGFFA